MKTLILGLIFGAALFGQSAAGQPAASNPPSSNPGTFLGFGTGFQIGQGATVWGDYCKKTTESVYGCVAADLGKTVSTRAGVETILLHRGKLYVTVKGDAGGSTSKAGSGAAYGAGASAVYDVSAWTKVTGTYAVLSVSELKQDIANVRRDTVLRVGLGKTF